MCGLKPLPYSMIETCKVIDRFKIMTLELVEVFLLIIALCILQIKFEQGSNYIPQTTDREI